VKLISNRIRKRNFIKISVKLLEQARYLMLIDFSGKGKSFLNSRKELNIN
jgi:hypothetical protein